MNQDSQTKDSKKLKTKKYEKALRKLPAELCKLQDWVKHRGSRVIIIFEGRNGAGEGGTIHAITERVSPRVFRHVALHQVGAGATSPLGRQETRLAQ